MLFDGWDRTGAWEAICRITVDGLWSPLSHWWVREGVGISRFAKGQCSTELRRISCTTLRCGQAKVWIVVFVRQNEAAETKISNPSIMNTIRKFHRVNPDQEAARAAAQEKNSMGSNIPCLLRVYIPLN